MNDKNVLSPSGADSARFGYRIYRGKFDNVEPRSLLKAIISDAVDIAIVRVPAGSGKDLLALSRFGMHPIHADTLVYYEADLDQLTPQPLRNQELQFSIATTDDTTDLARLVSSTFEGYVSHYHANPHLDAEDILEGYAEWAAGFIDSPQSGRSTWIAKRHGKIVAFACCAHNDSLGTCEGVLYGVHPDHSGGGLYGDLIRHTQASYKSQGFKRMQVSTQIWNLAVQKVWSREGFLLKEAFDTYHVNALLSGGHALVTREASFSAAQVLEFATATGDTNPVHLDDEAARKAGFEKKITHGMLAGGLLSKIFGTEIPGPGTLFLRSELVFLKPIYAEEKHIINVRYASSLPLTGNVKAISTIHNASGELCLLSYNDLLIRN